MLKTHNRALKEWALACRALREGRQTVLVRKGGIREEDGIFRVDDSEFFLMPTWEHQNPDLLQESTRGELSNTGIADPSSAIIDTYCQVDAVIRVRREESLPLIQHEHIWNEAYIRLRLEFNPYDPLFVILLRAYSLPTAAELPLRPEYLGCRSWVTLERHLSTEGAVPALGDEEFERRKSHILSAAL